MIFEFFMPLTNEGILRVVLDDLFYIDTIMYKLKKINMNELKKAIPKLDSESQDVYYKRIIKWISNRFGGYSIAQVMGRFKCADLQTFEE